MRIEPSSDLIAFATTARSVGNLAEVRAAAEAAARLAPARADAWLLLLGLEAAAGRWDSVLEVVDAAAVLHPGDAAIATHRARALFSLSCRVDGLAELKRIAREYMGALDALEMLTQTTAHIDPVVCLAAVEQAIAEGLTGRDYLLVTGSVAAALIGEFERGERLIARIAEPAARERAAAKIAREGAAWRAHEKKYGRRLAAGTLGSLWDLIVAREMDLARYAAARRLLEQCPAEEHARIVMACHHLGFVGTAVLTWAAYSAERHPDHPAAMLSHVDVLLGAGAFGDAGAVLRTFPPQSIAADDLLRRQVFCCAAGGLDAATLIRTLAWAQSAAPEAAALAVSYLARGDAMGEGIAAYDPQDRRTIALRGDADDAPIQAVRRFYRPQPGKRPRVAVCISGQLRSFRQTWPQTRAALARWKPVVFVSTWSGVGAGFGAHDSVERCLPPAVRDRLPLDLRRRTLFEAALPGVARTMAASDEVTTEELQDFYGTRLVRVHDESAFDRAHDHASGLKMGDSLNQAKMFFTLADVSAMRSAEELHCHRLFDAVLRVRPDRAITHIGEQDVERVSNSRTILSDYFMPGAIGDQGMLSGSEVADRLGEIWPRMKAAGSTRFFPGSRGLFNEFLIAEHMMHSGVGIGKYLNTHSMGLTPMVAPIAPLWAALVTDIAGSAVLTPEIDRVFAAFCDAAAEEHEASGEAALLQPLPAALVARIAGSVSERAPRFLQASPRA